MTYEYLCKDCKRVTEVYMENMDPPKTTKCFHCGRRATKIIGSTGGFILKGHGWPGKELTLQEGDQKKAEADAEFKRRQDELRRDGFEFPYDN